MTDEDQPVAEQPMSGGNMGLVSRRGDVVLRAAGEWTPAVHRLLAHLRARGVVGVPEPMGLEPDGREAVGFVQGEVPAYPMPGWVWHEPALTSSALLLRALHDASASADQTGPWRSPVREPAEVVCHNDFAPYNLVFRDGRAVGVIDFDHASPGPRIWDLAYLAYRLVPLGTDRADGFSAAERAARLDLLCATYGSDAGGPFTPVQVLPVVVARLDHLAVFSDDMAEVLGNPDLHEHADLYRRDAAALRSQIAGG